MSGDVASPLTCLLADDNEPILAALATLLRAEGVDVVATARTGAEALRLLANRRPTTVVLDVRLPDLSGVEVTRRLLTRGDFQPAVILYTSYADFSTVTRALDAGARGVVLKDAPPSNLLDALVVVTAGGIYIDPRLRGGPEHRP